VLGEETDARLSFSFTKYGMILIQALGGLVSARRGSMKR
jgi:hypothetical protein